MKIDPLIILAVFGGLAFGWVAGFCILAVVIVYEMVGTLYAQRKYREKVAEHVANLTASEHTPERETERPGGYV